MIYSNEKPRVFEWARAPELAPDGSALWFERSSLFSHQWQVYRIRDGLLRDTDAGEIRELRETRYAGKAIPVRRDVTAE